MERFIRDLLTPGGLLLLLIIGLTQKVHTWFQQNQTTILIATIVIVLAFALGVYFWERKQRLF